MSEQEYLDDLLNVCLSDINTETDEETDKKLNEHKQIVQNNIKSIQNNLKIDNNASDTLSSVSYTHLTLPTILLV